MAVRGRSGDALFPRRPVRRRDGLRGANAGAEARAGGTETPGGRRAALAEVPLVGRSVGVRRWEPQVIAHSQYQKSQRISIFLSMQDEIETDEIIKDIFRRGKTCFVPRYRFQSNHMDMVRLASPEEIASLPKTSWNIHQPGEDEAREEALSTDQVHATITQLFLFPRSKVAGI
ncbi:5-formyltetrahydrofolate cyclo-ligase-like isoform X3 [Myotis myotis]|uniref:5-formyltetrahydrofolate cyclo-ligase-like isoform X3 n=1 Tax=Myotis myotis TaxID=51298 RepID=UPI00174B66E8|nr:5-formyltetrahydrofolate cyclo-ligase-like isoform X3 [Myotis myotis]